MARLIRTLLITVTPSISPQLAAFIVLYIFILTIRQNSKMRPQKGYNIIVRVIFTRSISPTPITSSPKFDYRGAARFDGARGRASVHERSAARCIYIMMIGTPISYDFISFFVYCTCVSRKRDCNMSPRGCI